MVLLGLRLLKDQVVSGQSLGQDGVPPILEQLQSCDNKEDVKVTEIKVVLEVKSDAADLFGSVIRVQSSLDNERAVTRYLTRSGWYPLSPSAASVILARGKGSGTRSSGRS